MPKKYLYLFLAVIVYSTLSACSSSPSLREVSGQYRGVLNSPGGELAFPVHVNVEEDSLTGYVINGTDTASFNVARLKGDSLILGFDYYDSYLRTKVKKNGNLTGKWTRRAEGGKRQTMKFTAEKGVHIRYPETSPDQQRFDGEWQATFTDEDGPFPAHGRFVSRLGGKLYGTFQTETGDYRYLDGVYTDSTSTLSTFDGPHAFLFKAKLQDDGTLKGDFWSKGTYHATWTAHRGKNRLKDPLQMAADEAIGNNVTFSFPNIEGDTVSASDPVFEDKPMLVYLFGSWCPNCADEARMLRNIYAKQYKDTELQIVGLAFEYTGDFQKDARMVSRYKERFNIPWHLLIAGTSDKSQAADQLPFLDKILSYPTSIFVNSDHEIEAIHVGFNGPATGSAYYNEIQRYNKHINEILN